jgi:hypothetical protein
LDTVFEIALDPLWMAHHRSRMAWWRPDALTWGKLAGREALFRLEVESSNASRAALRRKTARRFERALIYAKRFSLALVFALLAPPWVRRAAVESSYGCQGMQPWSWRLKAFGVLPVPHWGSARGG